MARVNERSHFGSLIHHRAVGLSAPFWMSARNREAFPRGRRRLSGLFQDRKTSTNPNSARQRTRAIFVKSIILDIDGTLIDSMGVDPELYFASIEQVVGSVCLRELDEYDHVTDSGILRQILEENGHSGVDEHIASVKELFMEGLNSHIEKMGAFPVIDGAIQFVERLRSSTDVRIAIATGCWRESALLKLQTSGFDIDGIPVATSDDSPSRVEIMRSALQMTGNDSGAVTYFGDAEWDQRACHDLGWDFVAVGPRLGGIESFSSIRL